MELADREFSRGKHAGLDRLVEVTVETTEPESNEFRLGFVPLEDRRATHATKKAFLPR